MEYEKPPTAPAFSRKLRNRSHSLSFSTNVVYDGVFSSPASKKPPPLVDYGEVFRGSGPSSSIPFLNVPELNEEKVKVDVRSSKLDYSSVFGGFQDCDFTVSPEELIIKSERKSTAEEHKRNRKKTGNSSDVPPSSKAKNQISSPEVVSMKQFKVSYHQTAPRNEDGVKGTTQVAEVYAVSGYTQSVDNTYLLPNMESRTPIVSVEEPFKGGSIKVTDCNKAQVDIPSSNGSWKRSSKNEVEFENIFGRTGSNIGDSFTDSVCKTDRNAKHPDVTPPSSLQHSRHGDKEASERSMGPKSGVSEGSRSEDANSPCSPPYFDEETDANSDAAASSAALKKAIEEAQLKMNIAKQMMERKKAGLRSHAKSRSSDSHKVEDKGNRKFERQTEKCKDNDTKNVGEVANSSKESSANVGEQIPGEMAYSFKQSFSNAGERNVGEVVNSSEQSFPIKGEHNVGELVNTSEKSIPNQGEQILDEMVDASKQSFPNVQERNVGEVVNSSEQSIQNEGERIPNEGEQILDEMLNASKQSFPNVGERNVGEVENSSKQTIQNEGEQNVGQVVNSSELLFPKEGDKILGETVSSSKQSFANEGEENVGEMVNLSDQSFPNKGEGNVGEVVNSSEQSFPNKGEQNVGELVNSSRQSFPNQGEQQVKRARRLWEVPGGLLKSTLHHLQEEAGEHEVIKLEEEPARKTRKHWEISVGRFKSIVNGKQHETENLAAAQHATDTNREMQTVTETTFYSFGQLGNKIKCVVEAFKGSKVAQKSEAEGTEHAIIDSHENSNLTHVVLDQEGEQKKVFEQEEILVDPSDTEKYEREVEVVLKPTDSQGTTQVDENAESTMCNLIEGSSQKEKETGWCNQPENASELPNAPLAGVNDNHESSNLIHEVLDQEDQKESLSEPLEMLIGSADMETYEREVEEILRPTQSMSKIQIDENAGSMVSILTENASVSGNAPEGKEEHKTPRRRRVWKTSEDVYDMIKGLKRYNNRAWQLEDDEKEMMKRCLREQSARVDDAIDGEEIEGMSELPTDSGLQENWNVLKQMFRQMFQTVDTKREDETCCLVESEQNHIEIHQRAEVVDRKATVEPSNFELTGADILNDAYKQDTMETARTKYEAYVHTRENEKSVLTLKTHCNKQDVDVEEQNRSSFVYELIGEELEAIEMANNQEVEDTPDVSEADDLDQGAFELDEIKEQPNSRADIPEHDQSEMHSSNFDEKFEQKPCEERAEEAKINGCTDDDTKGLSFESGRGDSDIEEVDLGQEVYDQRPEKSSTASSMGERVEEVDSESNKSGWDVEDVEFISKQNEDDDNLKSFLEESLAGYAQDAGASQPPYKPEEVKEIKEKFEDNECKPDFECPEEFDSRCNMEAAESPSNLSKGEGEKVAQADRNMEEIDREYRRRSPVNEKRDATGASQNVAEPIEEHLKNIDNTKEKEKVREKERIMVERAIREARERAFADARERAERAAMEKANTAAHRRTTSEVRGRSEKASVEANDKLSSAERASMQAKLRAERAAVERALAEARERALEKALSGKAASQARSQGGKSSSSSGDRRGFSYSSTENRSSAPPSSSNQSANGEPAQRCKARSERHQRTVERAAKALAEKKLRDLIAQKEQAERNRLAETLDAEVKRWSSGKEGNLRALLSTLQYILGPESGWKLIHLTDLVSSAAVRKAYRKATLYVHPDKLQQRGAATQQKYICEKVFDLLKEAWNKFSAEER